MAAGSRDGRIDPKQMSDLTFTAPDNGVDDTKKCSGDTLGSERVKLSFYVELDASGTFEKSDERGVVAPDTDTADARNSAGTGTNIESGEDRKKRYFDRYDSSESSDSGVAVLSPVESSGCSSSDITEPGSPRSPDSGITDDGATARMPPWASEPARPPPRRRITEYFNHKMKPTTLKRDPTIHDTKKNRLPKNGVDELKKYISYLSQTLSPQVLRDIHKVKIEQNHAIAKHDLGKSMNGLVDYSRPNALLNGHLDHKQVPESSTKEVPLRLNGLLDAKKHPLEKTDLTASETVAKKRKAEPLKRKVAIPQAKDLVGVRVAPLAKTEINDMVSSTTKLDCKMNGVMCGSNNISLNPIAPKPASAKREPAKKPAQPAKRTNRKSSGCIANSKNLTWSKANNLKQVQMKQNCANATQASLDKSMPHDPNTTPKMNVPNGVRQVPMTVNGNLSNMNVPATNFQNSHQINFQQQCNGTVTSTNLASFVAVPQNVMLTTLRIPQNGISAQTLNQPNNMSPFARQNVGVSSPTKLNGQFVFPLVQNFQNGAVVQIPNLMAKYPNFVLPQSTQITTQRQDHLQNQQAAQILINGTLLKLASTMNSAYANVNKSVPPTSQSIPSLNKNVPGIPNVGLTVQKQNFTVNLSHPMLVSQPGFIVTSVPNISVKETWSSTHTYSASSTQNNACPNPIVHHPPPVIPSFPSQALHSSSIPIASVKPPDNPIQGTDPPSSTVKEPEPSDTIPPKCDIPWLTKTINNNNVSFDKLLSARPFAQIGNLTEKLPEYAPPKIVEDKMDTDSEPEKLRSDKTSEEIRRLEEVARREETIFTQITVLKDVSSNVQSSVIESNYSSATTESSESGIGTDKSIDSPCYSQTSKEGDEDSSLSLSISISSAEVQSSQKSPILKQPKTLRFPPKSAVKTDSSKRTSSTDTTSSVTICQWENCKSEFESDTDLLEHLQVVHVETQAGRENYTCQWQQCKVKGKPSCSRLWLERHALSHGGNKPFKCIVDGCGRRFSTQILLERHVNNHFNEQSPNTSSSKKSADSAPKLLRRNGKKLRYRRQPWSARMFDFFDAGTMEGLAWRLARSTRWRLGGACPLREPAGRHTLTLHAAVAATRYNAPETRREALVTYYPPNVLDDEWLPEKDVKRIKRVEISQLSTQAKVLLFEQFSASYRKSPSPPPKPLPPVSPQQPSRVLPARHCTSSRLLNNLIAKQKKTIEPKEECPSNNLPMVYREDDKDKLEVSGAKKRKMGRRHGGNAFWPCGR